MIGTNPCVPSELANGRLVTMEFPSEMLVEYVRVYQRKGQTNIGYDPSGCPTTDCINRHLDTYSNPNLTAFNYLVPVFAFAHKGVLYQIYAWLQMLPTRASISNTLHH